MNQNMPDTTTVEGALAATLLIFAQRGKAIREATQKGSTLNVSPEPISTGNLPAPHMSAVAKTTQ
jgi:hypothetical protein